MPCSFVHLSLEERRQLARLREQKIAVDEIACRLGRHRSTIYRELKRNFWHDAEVPQAEGYWPVTAQQLAVGRRRSSCKLLRHPQLCAAVVERLKDGWSPEQIAGRLKVEPGSQSQHRLCHDTITRFVYSAEGQSQELARHLPERRRKRRPRFARSPRSLVFPEAARIHHRPEAVNAREEFGHWEADLMIFRKEHGPANIATVVERKSRFTVLFRNNDRRSKSLMGRLIDLLSPLPQAARQSLTFDRGLEFVSWRELEAGMGAKAWFCDPQAPWQKGSVENMNRRVRRYFPADTVLLTLADRSMRSICDRLNGTLRKCLG
ncbi:IS30 family transposase [Rubellimicrobium rubrum]|uniref:IS30 family transposase n=1 Tax=Rubellimicrobium rubrum TaxID=2585369 RepID=A0A5C4MNR6_9RHOB|nr:IS30 family transposase [Rubellimicrobium rubrum]TNC46254.1 IS30 family transposase [Rubellimicrobium rubrum]